MDVNIKRQTAQLKSVMAVSCAVCYRMDGMSMLSGLYDSTEYVECNRLVLSVMRNLEKIEGSVRV